MIYMVSDIHGRTDRFDSVMKQINLQKDGRLYVLSDVIDRNEDDVTLMFCLAQMPNATLLLGNHELMMRDCVMGGDDSEEWIMNSGMVALMEYFSLSAKQKLRLWDYLRQLPTEAAVQVNDKTYLLTHSMLQNLCTCQAEAVWERVEEDTALPEDRTLVFGHTPAVFYQDDDQIRIWHGDNRIDIDYGCSASSGRLACLRLDGMKELYSENEIGNDSAET